LNDRKKNLRMGDTVSTLLFQPPPPTKLKEEKVIWLKTRRGATVPAFYISYRSLGGADVSRSLTLEELKKSKAADGITILYSHANAVGLGVDLSVVQISEQNVES
jgi:hypothetical protein